MPYGKLAHCNILKITNIHKKDYISADLIFINLVKDGLAFTVR